MTDKKRPPGRPKHVAEYATGEAAQNAFADAMRTILSKPKKPVKKRAA